MLLPIACRFVPYDQWCVTHVDDAAKVSQLKLWLLAKSNLVQSPGPHTQRAVSPIVFASSVRARSSIDSLDDGYNEDDEFSDHDLPPAIYPHREHRPAPQPPTSPLVDQYVLLAFSTGALLEDDFPLAWYHLRPYELLEMHPVGFLAPLRRDVLAEYVQPYFQAKVRVLRSLWSSKSGRFDPSGPDAGQRAMERLAHRLDALASPSHSEKKRKTKVEWKSRWLVVNQGLLSICKDHVTNPPVQQFPLNAIAALRGTDALERAFSIVTQPRVVCIKFRPRSLSGVASPPPSLPSSPILEDIKITAQTPFPLHDSTDQSEHADDPDDPSKGRGEWIVLDMLDDHAFSSILRILHRQAPAPISSSFVPSPSIIVAHNSVPSPAPSSFARYDAIPYPEWRIHTVENARKAGMGDVGKAMACVLWNEKGLGESLMGNIRHHRQAFSEEMQYKVAFPPDVYGGSGDESDDESELEWEGWIRDLDRQGRAKQWLAKANKSARPPKQTPNASLPSPPLSEASPSGSPRVRSPSLSASKLYPNIGNVISAGGARSPENGHSSERMKSTTVSSATSIGQARRRSSTLLSDLGVTRRDYDKGRQDREPSSSTLQSARAITNARTVSITAGLRSPSTSTPLRHARSSSNLRGYSSPYVSDAADSAVPGPSSPSKRQSAFMRGVSLRAGRLVRGLESAIDFVDEKTM